ncbi:MAG: helix-turn-helix transcriptional regulator, partial [Sphingobacterium siyangense]
IIQQLRQEVVKISESDPAYLTQVTDNLNALLQQHIMTDERWQKFKHVFNKVYPAYLTQMRQTYPKITENDLKILALLKLDLSNASMSELLCVSVEAVRKAKQRLKKKLEQTEK